MKLTDKERRKLAPTRASGTARWPTVRSMRQLAKTLRGRSERELLEACQRGLATDVEPALGALREAAFGVVSEPTLEQAAALSTDALAVAERMLSRISQGATLTDVVVLAKGVADAVEVKRRSLAYDLRAEPHWRGQVFAVTAAAREPRRYYLSWLPLRHAVCAASEAAYAEARARASEGWDAMSADEQALLAYTFPDEPWAGALQDGLPSGAVLPSFLLSALSDPAQVLELARAPHGPSAVSRNALELALALPVDDALALFAEVLPSLLQKPKHRALFKTPPRAIVAAVAAIGDARAAEQLAPWVGHRIVGAAAATFFQDAPEHRAALRGEGASVAAGELADRFDELAALGLSAPPVDAERVPRLLRERAWRVPKRKSKAPVIRAVSLPLPVVERVERPPAHASGLRGLPPAPKHLLAQWREDMAYPRGYVDCVYDYKARIGYRIPAAESLAAWRDGRGYPLEGPLSLLVEHGSLAIDGFVSLELGCFDYESAEAWIDAAQRVISPRIAPLWARLAVSRKRWRRVAHSWLEQHAEMAATGLIPAAVGPAGTARKDAEAVFRHLMRAGHTDAIRAAAALYEGAVVDALEPLLKSDLRVVQAKPPKLPPFLRPNELPPIELRTGGRFPDDARDALLELLSVAPEDYPGFEEITEACEPLSLDRFVTALVGQWAGADGPGKGDWIARAAVALPGERSTDRVSQLARRWARQKQAPARRACEALASIGSDVALLHLGHIAATARFKTLREETARRLDEVARVRGLTRDELEDRTVPDLGLDERGQLRLQFSERDLRASLDETLQVVLLDEQGARLRTFPRGNSKDLERKAAKARYGQLKKDVKAIAVHQRRRLERAMVWRRTWTLAEARSYFFEHPLARHLAHGLVWTDGSVAFRVAEDGTFTSQLDEEELLEEGARVWIAHPMELDEPEAWSRLFADYEILQPFPQLGRSLHEADEAELTKTQIERVKGWTVSAKKVLGVLESRGWRRDEGGSVSSFARCITDDLQVTLPLSPGFEIADLGHSPEVTLGAARVARDGKPAPIAELGPITYSEVILELEALR